MTDTITVRSHTRKKSAAILAFEDLRRERVAQLQREIEARKAIDKPVADLENDSRKRRMMLIDLFQPWFWRRG